MLNNVEISKFMPMKKQYPINNMPKNKVWTVDIQPGMFVENNPST